MKRLAIGKTGVPSLIGKTGVPSLIGKTGVPSLIGKTASLIVIAMTGIAHADRYDVPDLPVMYTGVFQPADVTPSPGPKLDVIAHGGSVQVLAPTKGAPIADGAEVIVVHPLLGMAARARVEKSRIQLPGFLVDRRPRNDGVIVLVGKATPVFREPTAEDVKGIREQVAKAPSLENVKRAIDPLEIGAVDLDRDGIVDLASTYGCTVWGDGACQVFGQFVLIKRAGNWSLVLD